VRALVPPRRGYALLVAPRLIVLFPPRAAHTRIRPLGMLARSLPAFCVACGLCCECCVSICTTALYYVSFVPVTQVTEYLLPLAPGRRRNRARYHARLRRAARAPWPRRQHPQAAPRTPLHTSAYVSIRQHTSAYVSIHVSIRQHTSAYVSIRQHTSAYQKPT
jgi:hypothetical protein